jgi:hypothetical protein
MVSIRTFWSDLRQADIKTRLPNRLLVLAADGAAAGGVEARAPTQGAPSGELVTGKPLGGAATGALPPALQAEFAKFMKLPFPRALAVGPGDALGVASSGQQVIARAIAACNARRKKGEPAAPCRLYAVDETLVSGITPRNEAPSGGDGPALASPQPHTAAVADGVR